MGVRTPQPDGTPAKPKQSQDTPEITLKFDRPSVTIRVKVK